jgi:hypothetical protein
MLRGILDHTLLELGQSIAGDKDREVDVLAVVFESIREASCFAQRECEFHLDNNGLIDHLGCFFQYCPEGAVTY